MPATRLSVCLLLLLGASGWAQDVTSVRVYVASESGKTIYASRLKPQLKVHLPTADEPGQVRLRNVELEKGHRPVMLDHDGLLLRSVLEDAPTYFAEIVLNPERPEMVSSHLRGVLIGVAERIESAELTLVLEGQRRTFVPAPSGSLLRWVSGLSYPLSTCQISGERLADSALVPRLRHEGRTFLTCCGRCKRKIKDDPAAHVEALDAAILRAQLPTYPLEVCPITGDLLAEAEAPSTIIVEQNRMVRLKSADYEKTAHKRVVEILERLDLAVVKQQLPTYPLSSCVVSGDELAAGAINYICGTRLVRLCCRECIALVEVDPESFLAKIDAAGQK